MNIVHYPDPALTTYCPRRGVDDVDYKFLAMEMVAFMKDGGLWGEVGGLAANQVGSNLRMFIINGAKEDGSDCQFFINPEITWVTRAPKNAVKEGCYSLEDYRYYDVERAPSITLAWEDFEGVVHERRFNGLMAQIIQHECDHLEGRLCVDESVLKAEAEHAAKVLEYKINEMKHGVTRDVEHVDCDHTPEGGDFTGATEGPR